MGYVGLEPRPIMCIWDLTNFKHYRLSKIIMESISKKHIYPENFMMGTNKKYVCFTIESFIYVHEIDLFHNSILLIQILKGHAGKINSIAYDKKC